MINRLLCSRFGMSVFYLQTKKEGEKEEEGGLVYVGVTLHKDVSNSNFINERPRDVDF